MVFFPTTVDREPLVVSNPSVAGGSLQAVRDPLGDLRQCEWGLWSSGAGTFPGYARLPDIERERVCDEGSAASVLYHHGDNHSTIVCPPEVCLDADVEDMLALMVTSFQPASTTFAQQPRARAQGPGVWPPHARPPGSAPDISVCVEGPVARVLPQPLKRLGAALAGLGGDFRVLGVAAAQSDDECRRGRAKYYSAFHPSLAWFSCTVDAPLGEMRGDFLAAASNATWWLENERRFVPEHWYFVSLLRNLRMKSRCMDAVEAVERTRGAAFGWVVYLRSEYDFFELHPPLSAMATVGGIWVPDAEDYGGVNDKWAVLQRRHAPAYFRRWEALLHGTAIEYLGQDGGDISLVPEVVLLQHLRHHRLWPSEVHRFAPVAALRCDSSGNVHCQVPLLNFDARGFRGWRHRLAWADAYSTAGRIQHDGWAWNFTRHRWLTPPCPPRSKCCGPAPGDGVENPREDWCFIDGEFHTRTRCCSDELLLSISPPPGGGSMPSCWLLHRDPESGFYYVGCEVQAR